MKNGLPELMAEQVSQEFSPVSTDLAWNVHELTNCINTIRSSRQGRIPEDEMDRTHLEEQVGVWLACTGCQDVMQMDAAEFLRCFERYRQENPHIRMDGLHGPISCR